MSTPEDSDVLPITRGRDEASSVIIGSLVALLLNVVVYAALAVHTMLSRRRYGKFIEQMEVADLSLPAQFFILTPAPIYAAGYLLILVGLILKECALERKGFALRINLFALAVAACVFITFLWTVQFHFDALLEP